MTAPGTTDRGRLHPTMSVRSPKDVVRGLTSPVTSREDHDENGVHPLLTETEAV